jgi:hypothetical protein
MADLRDALGVASRERLLRYVASAIHGFTIMARDPGAGEQTKAEINNHIHYLAGHLMGLTDPEEPLTDSRLDGILEQVTPLNRRLAENIAAELIR